MITTKLVLGVVAVCAPMLLVAHHAAAANEKATEFPKKPITLIVPYPAAGGNDILARVLKAHWEKAWGQPVVVDNKPGANGMIGTQFVARAPADGYTLLMGSVATHAINPGLFPDLKYKVTDFAPVALIGSTPLILTVSKNIDVQNVGGLIALAKKKPGTLTYASVGNGSAGNLAGELFKLGTGADIVHVPYRGIAQASNDLLSGQVDMAFSNVINVLPYITTKRVKPLGVTSVEPLPALPDVPPIGATVKDYSVELWWGLFAPAGTPPEVLAKINAETNKMLQMAEHRARFQKDGITLLPDTAEAFSAVISRDLRKWGGVIRDSKIKSE